ncbi:hypothetical protein LJC46_08995 [Desulfovibrio sp. OttesenSCG-928-G15]|nr:hypothetical protein [Desulfovibrio sp. OttesenSCG-928-G15]
MHGKQYAVLIAACLITLVFGAHAALASSRCDTTLINDLGEPISAVKILYDTPYGEPRSSLSDIVLPPGREYRLGIQGVTLPTQIILSLPLSSFAFTDLSGLAPEPTMRLKVAYVDGVPRLEREDDPKKSVGGSEQKYLTPENRPYAVDRDNLTDCKTMEEVRTLVAETAAGAEPAETNLDAILFTESFDGRPTLYFPVFWTEDYAGFGSATPADLEEPAAGIGITVSVPLPDGDAPDAVDNLMTDLRVDGNRPALFNLYTMSAGEDKEYNFLEGEGDKYDDQDVVQEHLAAVLKDGALREAVILWVPEEAFAKAKAEKDYPKGPCVKVRIANGQFRAIFLP